ncbi:indolepyruvate ferredoxin oxidoreductase family protein (plasmid) [Burkholderia glumae]|uniref:indolepyruvate ferredoxin oxidoreductase family protein n=1 Tax=Burkholderia glumae TaxID=337 RepID=UPI0021511FD5|nr:indolepyruvate ferredoxin oxidoreductase family protein [Burkholderia glumae]UVS82789.1 indolepyruvate ferredoxin oxidoreductase family protein [Burkholderia glumae]UVT00234.1 indolepyruvate ferredoxin oxidoreductase family protein [Burkholderia glumae]
MNALPSQNAARALSLDDQHALPSGRVYLSGVQALVRLPMLQQQRDRLAGRATAGFVSGYRGSPLGGLDQALWAAGKHLERHHVVFRPGVNEDLAATAVWGSQQASLHGAARYDGVFAMWYGKGPGVDRSMDVFKHANSAGSSALGGVLVIAGDDHAAKSSSLAHQSEHVLKAAGMPVLYPSDLQEYLDFGLHGWEMSRYSGLWVAMKCVTDVVETSASVEIDPARVRVTLPADFPMPEGGLNIRWPDPPLAQEARMCDHKWYAAQAYVRANRLDRIVIDSPAARLGIVTAGKAYLDVRQALNDLGLDEQACARIGLRIYKVGCVWPLEPQGAREFATGLEEILVVEEKRQFLEYALKEVLYDWPDARRPRVLGKFDGAGEWAVPRGRGLLPMHNELSPSAIARVIAARLQRLDPTVTLDAGIEACLALIDAKERETKRPRVSAERQPWFCSGCPHNTSTRVPQGSRAVAGIGCHYMAMWMDRSTDTFSQMGGEGVGWIGQAPFSRERHIFANLGDGTYFHSGLLAIRASIAAGVNITYKLLYNDAVAMTGGQPVDGVLSVPQIVRQLRAEGAARIVVVSDEPEKYRTPQAQLPDSVTVRHRDALDAVQIELRDTPGTTVLIYDQVCATEKRRRRKRGDYPDPARRAFINQAVCEGCGDCSGASNCLSVEPVEGPFGVKRQINQSSCNKDFSCVNGFCPSFVTAEGAQLRRPGAAGATADADCALLPMPKLPALGRSYSVLICGVGGTGVVTIGNLLGMAAHIEGKGVTVLDMTGLAQKGGAVSSHVQIAASPERIHAARIALGQTDLLLGCDLLVAASRDVLSRVRHDATRAVINGTRVPTADFVRNPDWRFPGTSSEQDVRLGVGRHCEFLDAQGAAIRLFGDAIHANALLTGFAWQKGWIPLSLAALMQAIELNGAAVQNNRRAFQWGRYLAEHGTAVLDAAPGSAGAARRATPPLSLDALIESGAAWLHDYQDAAYARRYTELVAQVRKAESRVAPGADPELTRTVAEHLARMMAYKDEYEVARCYAAPAYLDGLRAQFEGEPGRDYRLRFHLAAPLLARKNRQGRAVKQEYGGWMLPVLRILARGKRLRGTRLDPFGHTAERRMERRLAEDYHALVVRLQATLSSANRARAIELARVAGEIRGFGHLKAARVEAARRRWSEITGQQRLFDDSIDDSTSAAPERTPRPAVSRCEVPTGANSSPVADGLVE